MGVYIKGMEMPKDCLKCPFCLFADGYWKCLVDGSHADFGGTCRPQNCPLVEIPPHGRLIEKGVLLYKCYQHFEDFMLGKVDGKTALLNIEKEIKAAPTIIPASGGNEDE